MKLYIRNVWVIKFLSICIDLILSLWSETHSSVKIQTFTIFKVHVSFNSKLRGVAIGGSGVRTNPPPPHGQEKVRKNRFFFLFFFQRDRTGKRLRWKGRKDAANRKQVMQDEAWPSSNGTSPKRRCRQRKLAVGQRARRGVARCECQTPSYRSDRSVELNGERPAVQTAKTKERLRCHHVQLNIVETSMGRKQQRERERKKAAKGSHSLSGFGFLPKKRSWSDGDLNATATSQRQLVEEDSSSRSSLQLQEQDEGSSLQSCSST